MLDLAKINTISGTQARSSLSQETVAEYAEAYKAGVNMPPVVVFYDGATYYLADGFHRFFGAKAAGLETIREEVTPGTLRDAILFSLKANETHGLRRTNADKRKAVETMLADAEWAKWSSNAIAKACGVSNHLVDDVRESILEFSKIDSKKYPQIPRIVERNGKTYEQNTANIGEKALSQEPTATPAPTEAPYDPREDEVAELAHTVRTLAAENDALKDRIAVEAMPFSEEEKTVAMDTLQELRAEVLRLEIECRALVSSRDSYMRDNAELKRQCAMQRSQIEKLQKAAS